MYCCLNVFHPGTNVGCELPKHGELRIGSICENALSSSIMLADAPVSIIICTGMLLTNTETVGVLVLAESPRVYRYSSSLLSVKSGCSWVATCRTRDFGLDCHWRGDVALCPELACFVRHIWAKWLRLPHLLQVQPLAGQGLSLWGHVTKPQWQPCHFVEHSSHEKWSWACTGQDHLQT